MNESFWDAQGVEIETCAIFEHFPGSGIFSESDQISRIREKISDWMLWGGRKDAISRLRGPYYGILYQYLLFAHQSGAPDRHTRAAHQSGGSENLFRFNLDAMSVPEALETTIRSLPARSIVLAR